MKKFVQLGRQGTKSQIPKPIVLIYCAKDRLCQYGRASIAYNLVLSH